jgi:D-alanyl-lipoteichoic acid acyltransferase DltB (MBOAT superfamily)
MGIAGNLVGLGYYKYFDFLVSNINTAMGSNLLEMDLILPLGISFFTFQQIAYLVDTSRNLTDKTNILEYAFFVSFFPQLIAGPIVHHRHILPAIHRGESFNFSAEQSLAGLHAFAIGFFKKVVIADSLVLASSAVFDAADAGQSLSSHDAILGTLSFTFYIYFDFSAYTDMAIGLALMFGVRLPKNFDSPLKATGFIDFWQRWHITLSEFLRDYVYIPLGGSRKGMALRYFNLLSTMLIGGLWHGATWMFVFWGGVHGVLLVANRGVRALITFPRLGFWAKPSAILCWSVTFPVIALTMIAARATTWSGLVEVFTAIFSPAGFADGRQSTSTGYHLSDADLAYFFDITANGEPLGGQANAWFWVIAAAVISFAMPNTWTLAKRFPSTRGAHRLCANLLTVATFAVAAFIILYMANRVTEFFYFDF